VAKYVSIGHENGPRRSLRGPFCLVAGTGFEPANLGCLAGRCLSRYARSHSGRPATFSRPTCLAPSRLFASVRPCSVSKSVANPLSDKDSRPAASVALPVNLRIQSHRIRYRRPLPTPARVPPAWPHHPAPWQRVTLHSAPRRTEAGSKPMAAGDASTVKPASNSRRFKQA